MKEFLPSTSSDTAKCNAFLTREKMEISAQISWKKSNFSGGSLNSFATFFPWLKYNHSWNSCLHRNRTVRAMGESRGAASTAFVGGQDFCDPWTAKDDAHLLWSLRLQSLGTARRKSRQTGCTTSRVWVKKHLLHICVRKRGKETNFWAITTQGRLILLL